MSRTKKTQLLALTSGLNLVITSLFSIILGRLILVYLGSEYNGINAIVTQFLMLLSVVEGGFTTASLVSLIKPYEEHDTERLNQLFAETSVKFKRITVISVIVGAASALIYGFAVNTDIPYLTVVAILLIGVVSSTYSIGFISKYRLVFQAAQEAADLYVDTAKTFANNIASAAYQEAASILAQARTQARCIREESRSDEISYERTQQTGYSPAECTKKGTETGTL
jgi:hypothetical protein